MKKIFNTFLGCSLSGAVTLELIKYLTAMDIFLIIVTQAYITAATSYVKVVCQLKFRFYRS
jgi:hypothetical protein